MPSNHALRLYPQVPSNIYSVVGALFVTTTSDAQFSNFNSDLQPGMWQHITEYINWVRPVLGCFWHCAAPAEILNLRAMYRQQDDLSITFQIWNHMIYYRTLHLSLRNTQTVPAESLKKWGGRVHLVIEGTLKEFFPPPTPGSVGPGQTSLRNLL